MKYEKAATAATCNTSHAAAGSGRRSLQRKTYVRPQRACCLCGKAMPSASAGAASKPLAPEHVHPVYASALARRKAKVERILSTTHVAMCEWVQLELPLSFACDQGEFLSAPAEAVIAGALEGGM